MFRTFSVIAVAILLATPLAAHALTLKKGETIASGGGINKKTSLGSISFFDDFEEDRLNSVSYTHLTLPTN